MSLNKYYKEKDYAEQLLKKRSFDLGARGDLKILAKYYKSLEKSKDEIEVLLYKFCNTKGKSWFNEVTHYSFVDSALNFINKPENVLVQIDSIGITKAEMDYLETLNYSNLDKKILFTLIVINKLKHKKMEIRGFEVDYTKNYFGGSGSYSYKTMMNSLQEKLTRTYREKEIHKTIKRFNDDGLTRTTQKTALELLFVRQIEECDEIVLEVKDFDMIGLYYDSIYFPDKVKFCEECKLRLIKITHGKILYCSQCKKEKQKEWDNQYKKRIRQSVEF